MNPLTSWAATVRPGSVYKREFGGVTRTVRVASIEFGRAVVCFGANGKGAVFTIDTARLAVEWQLVSVSL